MAELEKMEGMKTLCEICETVEEAVKSEFNKGIHNVDIQEMSLAVDMIKDLAEAREKAAKAYYYCQITDAMETAEYGKEYDEYGPRKYYTGKPEKEYMEPERMTPERYRDIDRRTMGRMYYTDGMNGTGSNYGNMAGMNGNGGRSENSRRRYFEAKTTGTSGEKMQTLEEYAKSLTEDVTEMVQGMTDNEKQMLRQKMQMLVQKI